MHTISEFQRICIEAVGDDSLLNFCDGCRKDALTLSIWIRGKSKPPRTRIAFAAHLLEVSERDVAMALYGVESQDAAIRQKELGKRNRENAARRQKYAACESVREKERARQRKRTEATRLSRASVGGNKHHAHDRYVLGLMGEDERRRYEVARAKGRALHQIKNKYQVGDRQMTAKELMRHVRVLVRRVGELETKVRRLEELAAADAPWRDRGHQSLESWIKSGDADAIEYRRALWQVKTHRRRAKEKQAGGHGVQPREWYDIMRSFDYRCAYCGSTRQEQRRLGFELEGDHVVPMPHGPNDGSNLVPACKRCNASKSDSDLLVWAAGNGIKVTDRVMTIYNAVNASREAAHHAQR